MPSSKEIGEQIKILRLKKKMTQAELAAKAGVTESAIANYEKGERVPKDDIKPLIANALGVRVGPLFFERKKYD